MLRTITLRWTEGLATTVGVRAVPIVFCVLLLAAATPIFSGFLPPLADYANHLARMHILAWQGENSTLSQLYQVHWAIIPNLLMDAVVPSLARVMDIYVAGEVFVFLTMLTLVTGPIAIHRALFGRVSPIPLVAFLFVYNGIMLFGLMNYLLGLGIALWGVACWIATAQRPMWLRLAMASVIVLVLFFCHLFAVGLFGLSVLSVELWHWSKRNPATMGGLTRLGALLALPFLSVPVLLLASPTMGLSTDVLWEPHGKVDGIYYIFQLYGDVPDLLFAVATLAGAVILSRRKMLSLHPAGWILLIAGSAVFLAMPRVLFGSWLADQRMPVAVLFLVIGFIRPMPSNRSTQAAFYAALIGVAVLRFADVQVNWQDLATVNDEFQASTTLIDRGSPVLVTHADIPAGSSLFQEALSHVPCIAVIERDALVSTLFSVRGKQILDITPQYRGLVDAEDGDPPTISQMLAATEDSVPGHPHYWDRWPEHYRYVYVLYTHQGDNNPAPDELELLHDGAGFQLYAVKGRQGEADL